MKTFGDEVLEPIMNSTEVELIQSSRKIENGNVVFEAWLSLTDLERTVRLKSIILSPCF